MIMWRVFLWVPLNHAHMGSNRLHHAEWWGHAGMLKTPAGGVVGGGGIWGRGQGGSGGKWGGVGGWWERHEGV